MAVAIALTLGIGFTAAQSSAVANTADVARHMAVPAVAVAPALPREPHRATAPVTPAQLAAAHAAHLAHLAHLARIARLAQQARQEAAAAAYARAHPRPAASDSIAGDGSHGAPGAPSGGFSVSSSFQQCVIRAESGGNPNIWNASGHWGLYQFSYSTWVAHGGSPSLFGHASAAYQTEIFWNTVRQDGGSDWSPYDGCPFSAGGTVTAARIVSTPVIAVTSTASRALAWAWTQAGKWYQWGGAGPSAYDCSGLVMAAYEHAGISLPHNTGMMLSSGKLARTWSPRPGDLVFFYGGSHVELYVNSGHTFGAHHTGTRISEVGMGPSPAFYRVT
jgi:cell wall-associated NlpC family hydrolase